MTKATRKPVLRALSECARRARSTAGHELALGRRTSAEAYSQVAAWLDLLYRAESDGLPLYWHATFFDVNDE